MTIATCSRVQDVIRHDGWNAWRLSRVNLRFNDKDHGSRQDALAAAQKAASRVRAALHALTGMTAAQQKLLAKSLSLSFAADNVLEVLLLHYAERENAVPVEPMAKQPKKPAAAAPSALRAAVSAQFESASGPEITQTFYIPPAVGGGGNVVVVRARGLITRIPTNMDTRFLPVMTRLRWKKRGASRPPACTPR